MENKKVDPSKMMSNIKKSRIWTRTWVFDR